MVMQVGNSLVSLELMPLEKEQALSSQFLSFYELLHEGGHLIPESGELNQEMFPILESGDNATKNSSVEGSLIGHLERIKADRHYEWVEANETPKTEVSPIVDYLAKTPREDNVRVNLVDIVDEIQHIAVSENDFLLTQLSPSALNTLEKAATELGAQQGNYFHRLKATGMMDYILATIQSKPISSNHMQPL